MGFLKLSKIKYLDDTLYELEKSLKKHDDLIGIEYLVTPFYFIIFESKKLFFKFIYFRY